MDDGFRNYDGTSAPRVASPEDSATKSIFHETGRSNAFDDASESSTRKLKNIPLHRIEWLTLTEELDEWMNEPYIVI